MNARRIASRIVADDREAGIKDVAVQLARMLGTGAEAMANAMSAVKKLGVDAVKKLLNTLKAALPDLDSGVRSRFSKAIMSVALASGALAAQGCVMSVTHFDGSYDDYRNQPQVQRAYQSGLGDRDLNTIYLHIGGHGRHDGYDRGRGHNRGYDRGHGGYDRGHGDYDRGHGSLKKRLLRRVVRRLYDGGGGGGGGRGRGHRR